jgi:hypothetical protein
MTVNPQKIRVFASTAQLHGSKLAVHGVSCESMILEAKKVALAAAEQLISERLPTAGGILPVKKSKLARRKIEQHPKQQMMFN